MAEKNSKRLVCEDLFKTFVEKIGGRLEKFPLYLCSWSPNVLSIISEMGREWGYYPWYEKLRGSKKLGEGGIDCTWHIERYRHTFTGKPQNVVLAFEYEDWPSEGFEKIWDEIKKLERLEEKPEFYVKTHVKMLVYCIDAYHRERTREKWRKNSSARLVKRDIKKLKRCGLKKNWLIIPFYKNPPYSEAEYDEFNEAKYKELVFDGLEFIDGTLTNKFSKNILWRWSKRQLPCLTARVKEEEIRNE